MKKQFANYETQNQLIDLGFQEAVLKEGTTWYYTNGEFEFANGILYQQAWRFILTKLEENYNLISVEIYTDDSGFVQYGQGQLFVFNDQQDGIRKAIELYKNNNEF